MIEINYKRFLYYFYLKGYINFDCSGKWNDIVKVVDFRIGIWEMIVILLFFDSEYIVSWNIGM